MYKPQFQDPDTGKWKNLLTGGGMSWSDAEAAIALARRIMPGISFQVVDA